MRYIPFVVIAAGAAYVSGEGLARSWYVPSPFQYLITGALHAVYVLRPPKTQPLLCAICWCTCFYLACEGMRLLGSAYPLAPAAVLEFVCLSLAARSLRAFSISARLTEWRRAQAQIAVQLRMSEGLLPWIR